MAKVHTGLKDFTVHMAPINGGTDKKTVSVLAYSPDLAAHEANRLHPGWITVTTRVHRLVKTEQVKS